MIEIDKERLLAVDETCEFLPHVRRGKKIHKSTVHRWMKKGVGGVKLESVVIGGRSYTSVEALQRFSEQRGNHRPVVRCEETEKKLKEYGF